tara:strand:+ start:356 stop:1900 length:1545 start_codon:yes stop_codon:yes gene_type:complete
MYRILSASKDTYITDKIINNNFRATDANVGLAGTLDVFKLFEESSYMSGSTRITGSIVELSRLLIKFDLEPLRKLTSSILDYAHPSFNCTLKLHDVYGGQTTPSNFKLITFPLSHSFDEGVGRDVVSFSDVDSSNFVTASVSGDSTVMWYLSGANRQGLINSDDIDIIASGNLYDGDGVKNLWSSQLFSSGDEDLSMDVTTIISATLANQIPDHGFRISFSGTQESDNRSRFVKRFGSRHANNTRIQPKLIIKYDDTVIDHHRSFYFNTSGSLFLNNYLRGQSANLLTGTTGKLYGVSGSSCLVLRVVSGTYSSSFTGSQHQIGDNFITGVYSASFLIDEFNVTSSLSDEIKYAGSATFKTYWESFDGTVGYYTGSFVANTIRRTAFNNTPSRLFINITNLRRSYRKDDEVKLRVFVENIDRAVVAKKLPLETKSEIFTKMYYRVRDYDSNTVIIPFDTQKESTRLSTDSDGMYFKFYMDSLSMGRTYVFDFLIKDQGNDQVFTDVAAKFRVEG